jgi:hypothetical protein
MKVLIVILLAGFTVLGFGQDEVIKFCATDTSEHKINNNAFEGFFNVRVTRHGNYFEYQQYKFMIPKDSLDKAYSVISNVEFEEVEQTDYILVGSFYADDLHAPTTKPDAFEKGKYSTTWAFKKYVEIWSNGLHLKVVFPKLTKNDYDKHPSFQHSIYIKKECYSNLLSAFKHKN